MPLNSFRLITERQLRSAMRQARPEPDDEWLNEWVPLIEDQVENYLGRRLLYEEGIVEYLSPSDEQFVILDRRPVHAVTEVRVDPIGGFGQITDTFGSTTVLEAGVEYFLQLDGVAKLEGTSASGMLWRRGQNFSGVRTWSPGLLAPGRAPSKGTVKVTYNGGYKKTDEESTNQIPGVVAAAVTQAAGVWFGTMVQVGVLSGESVTGYSWSQILGFNLGDNQFASIRGMLTSLKNFRGGAGMTSQG